VRQGQERFAEEFAVNARDARDRSTGVPFFNPGSELISGVRSKAQGRDGICTFV
jgi:hypothetical protein